MVKICLSSESEYDILKIHWPKRGHMNLTKEIGMILLLDRYCSRSNYKLAASYLILIDATCSFLFAKQLYIFSTGCLRPNMAMV